MFENIKTFLSANWWNGLSYITTLISIILSFLSSHLFKRNRELTIKNQRLSFLFDNYDLKNKDCYSIVVQADHSTFPESIAPAGEPMTVQIQALHKIIEKTMNANSKFVTSFLNIDQFK